MANHQAGCRDHVGPVGRGPARSRTIQEGPPPPATNPRYFTRIFHSIFQARLPALIFEQGGIPATVPAREIDPDPTGRVFLRSNRLVRRPQGRTPSFKAWAKMAARA
jgi:hypothetical protein